MAQPNKMCGKWSTATLHAVQLHVNAIVSMFGQHFICSACHFPCEWTIFVNNCIESNQLLSKNFRFQTNLKEFSIISLLFSLLLSTFLVLNCTIITSTTKTEPQQSPLIALEAHNFVTSRTVPIQFTRTLDKCTHTHTYSISIIGYPAAYLLSQQLLLR